MSSAEVRSGLAAALEAQDRRAVTIGLRDLATMGFSLSPETQARLAPLIDPAAIGSDWREPGPVDRGLSAMFAANAYSLEGSEPLAEVPASHRLIEGIAWDEARQRLFVGSVIDRRLLFRDGEGWRPVPMAEPVGGVFGMAVDAPRRLLWFASAGVDPMVPLPGVFSGLVAIDLDRLEETRRIAVPGAQLGDVAIADDGTVYASDGQSGAIYRCLPGCSSAEQLIPPGILRSPQGMVVARHGSWLYVADYVLGLFRIELASLDVVPMIVRRPLMLDGIDGLLEYPYEGALIGIQNGTRPRRIVKIRLDRGGRIIESVQSIEQNVPAWGEPTLGALIGPGLLYVADAQWERWGAGDMPTDGGPLRPTAIRRIDHLGDIVVTSRTPAPIPSAPGLASNPTGS